MEKLIKYSDFSEFFYKVTKNEQEKEKRYEENVEKICVVSNDRSDDRTGCFGSGELDER